MCGGEEKEKEKENDISLRNLWRIGGQNASGQETKLVYATRATRGYQKLWVSLRSKM